MIARFNPVLWLLNWVWVGADCTDVDDVLSARQLDSGDIQIGVHIADVSAFVLPVCC